MAIYIISNDNYLQEGIVLLAKEANLEIVKETMPHLPVERLTGLFRSSISSFSETCKKLY